MKFRVRKRNPAYKRKGSAVVTKAIPPDMFVILDSKEEYGYRLASNGSYWSSEEDLKCGDLDFVDQLFKLIGKKLADERIDVLPEYTDIDIEDYDTFLFELITDNGYFIEAGENDVSWFPYSVYDKLKDLDDV